MGMIHAIKFRWVGEGKGWEWHAQFSDIKEAFYEYEQMVRANSKVVKAGELKIRMITKRERCYT